jgi:hypothetical protein
MAMLGRERVSAGALGRVSAPRAFPGKGMHGHGASGTGALALWHRIAEQGKRRQSRPGVLMVFECARDAAGRG